MTYIIACSFSAWFVAFAVYTTKRGANRNILLNCLRYAVSAGLAAYAASVFNTREMWQFAMPAALSVITLIVRQKGARWYLDAGIAGTISLLVSSLRAIDLQMFDTPGSMMIQCSFAAITSAVLVTMMYENLNVFADEFIRNIASSVFWLGAMLLIVGIAVRLAA